MLKKMQTNLHRSLSESKNIVDTLERNKVSVTNGKKLEDLN